jgi:hypothetical protein
MKRLLFMFLSLLLVAGGVTLVAGTGESASAATGPTTAGCASASGHVTKVQHRVKKAKKHLRKAKRHHNRMATKHARKQVKKLKKRLNKARVSQRSACTAPPSGGTTTPPPASTSVNGLVSLLSALGAPLDLPTSQLGTALSGLTGSPAAAGLPAAVTSAVSQLGSALSGTGDPTAAFQQLLNALSGQSLDPTKLATALQGALTALQGAVANPPTDPQGLVDTLLNALSDGLTTAKVPTLPSIVDQLQSALDTLLGTLGGGQPV